jgi:hypothetical protein
VNELLENGENPSLILQLLLSPTDLVPIPAQPTAIAGIVGAEPDAQVVDVSPLQGLGHPEAELLHSPVGAHRPECQRPVEQPRLQLDMANLHEVGGHVKLQLVSRLHTLHFHLDLSQRRMG